ncbi:MAG TPA: DUF4167 domain-containing protein, partial [Hellea balneolensis]|nr:DUF4167 domain-containing protein [Hellea balneolensis]
MKRQRGRNRRPKNNNNNNPNRSFDSNGPDIKVRGSAKTIYDKYITLARDAASGGSRVKAESYLQHAEHYLRILKINQAKQQALMEQKQAQQEAQQAAREKAAAARKEDNGQAGEKPDEQSKRPSRRKPYKNGTSDAQADETSAADQDMKTQDENQMTEVKKPRRRRVKKDE